MATLNLSSLQNLSKTEENPTDVQVTSGLENNVIIEEKPQETRKPLISLGLKKNIVEIPKEEIPVEIKNETIITESEEDKKEESTNNDSTEKIELVADIIETQTLELENIADPVLGINENEEKISPKINIGAINLKNKEEEQNKTDAGNIETTHEDVISIVSGDTFKEEVVENKEFFTNFNIEDEFRMDELLPKNIITTEDQSTEETVKGLSIEPKKEEVEIIAKEEVEIKDSEIQEIQAKDEIIESIQEVTTKEEDIKTEEKIEENASKDVDQIKKELSSDRKPAGVNSFKRKIIIASFGVFVLVSLSIGFLLGGDSFINGGKINIKESTGSSVDKTIDNTNSNNTSDNSNTVGSIISSGTGFKIIKNNKKNIKKIKTHSGVTGNDGVISDNTGTITNTGNPNSGATNTGVSDENRELINGLQGK